MSDLLNGFLDGLLGTDHVSALQRLGKFSYTLIVALVVVAITFAVASRLRNATERSLKSRKGDYSLALLLGRAVYILVLFLGLIVVLRVFGIDATALVATLGVVGLAVSLAMQDVLKNVFAGIYLLVERPFRPGETVKVRDFVGVVETIDLRTTTLRADAEVIYVPNAILFAEILINRGAPKAVPEENLE